MESRCNILYHIRSHGFFEFQYVYHMICYFWVEFNKGYDKLGRHVRQRQWLLFRFVVFLRSLCRCQVLRRSVAGLMWWMKAFQGNVCFFWKNVGPEGLYLGTHAARNVCRGWGRQSHRRKFWNEEMERKHQRKPLRKQFSFPHVSLVETMSSNFNLGRAIASVMLPAFFYLVGWPMNSTLMWSHLEDGDLVGGSFLLDQSGGDMKFMDANGAKIEFLISEKSDFDLKVGIFF